MATVPAGEVFRLLDGALAWRQHDGGHTDAPNGKYFIPWASRQLNYRPEPPPPISADTAAPRLDANSIVAHGQLLEKAKTGRTHLYFLGDPSARRPCSRIKLS